MVGKTVIVVVDGAYAKRPLLEQTVAAGIILVSRLRKDTALWTVSKTQNKTWSPPATQVRHELLRCFCVASVIYQKSGHSTND